MLRSSFLAGISAIFSPGGFIFFAPVPCHYHLLKCARSSSWRLSLSPLSDGKGIKVHKEEKQRRKGDQRECRNENDLTLHSIMVDVQLVFANVIPC